MRLILLPVFLALVLTACDPTPRYTTAPDASWKEREAYCWSFIVDPRGDDNHTVGWTDTEPTLTPSGDGLVLRAERVRVGVVDGSYGHSVEGLHEDYFEPVVIRAISEGSGDYLNITGHCALE